MEFNATFFVSAVSFIVFVFVMNKILYAPLERVVDERKSFVDANYEDAKSNSEKSTALIKDRADKLLKAGQDAKGIMNNKTDEANAKRDEMTGSARLEAQKNISANNDYLKKAEAEANQVLKGEVVKLAQAISDKFFQNEKIEDVDDSLVEKVMQG